jgi:NitT/TauT family transport system permease protein
MTDMLIHTLYSVWRLLAGVVLSMSAGTAVGVWIGYCRTPRKILSPLIYALAPVPKIALLPLVMLLFGIGEWAKIFIIFIVMVFQVILAVAGAVLRIPEEYYIPLRTVRAAPAFIIRKVVLPACLPELFTALRVGLATGISVLFFSETFGTRWGLGFYIMDRWMRLDYRHMALGIVMMALLGWGAATLSDLAEKKICKWR